MLRTFKTTKANLEKRAEAERSVNTKALFPSRSTEIVSVDNAQSLTAVYRSIQIIANIVSSMPIQTLRGDDVLPNPLIVNNPNLEYSRRDILFQITQSLAAYGESFLWIDFNSRGEALQVTPLHPELVSVNRDDSGQLWYGYNDRRYPANDRIRHLRLYSVPGQLRGYGPIQSCIRDLESALGLRTYQTQFYSQAGVPTGVLSTNSRLTAEEAETLRERWNVLQQTRQVAVLGNGTDYRTISISPKDALLIEAQQMSIQEIARLFGIPPTYLVTGVEGNSMTYANLTSLNQSFYQTTISAYLKAIEEAFSKILPRGQRILFKEESLVRSDTKTRYEAYAIAINNGFMTADEVRRTEGLTQDIPRDGSIN